LESNETNQDMLLSLTPRELKVLHERFGVDRLKKSQDTDLPPSSRGGGNGGTGGTPAPAIPPD